MSYTAGLFTIKRMPSSLNRVVIECYGGVSAQGTDHQQLIYEALEIAARSHDPYAADFAAFLDELMKLTEDWDEE